MTLDRADSRFLRRALIIAGLAALGLVLLKIVGVLALGFGAVLAAIVLRAVAAPIWRFSRLSETASVAAAVAILLIAAAIVLWLFGRELGAQLASLSLTIPVAWAEVQARLSQDPLGQRLLAELRSLDGRTGWLISRAPQWASDTASGAAALVIVLFAGVFLALRPKQYIAGALRLLPAPARASGAEVIEACGTALRQWLVAQFGSMLLVGVSVGVLLWLAGVGSPVALGLLAGLGQFVPVVGPFVVAAPGVLLALSESPERAGWAVLIYVVVGQIESNLFSPFLLRQTAQLPMAVTLFTVFAFGVLLGPLGVLFATPLAVVIFVLIKRLYVEGLLEAADAGPRPARGQPRSASPRPIDDAP